jgi:hypothetical protein
MLYILSDGDETRVAESWSEAVKTAESWYLYLADQDGRLAGQRLPDGTSTTALYADIAKGDINELNAAIGRFENKLGKAIQRFCYAQVCFNLTVSADKETNFYQSACEKLWHRL